MIRSSLLVAVSLISASAFANTVSINTGVAFSGNFEADCAAKIAAISAQVASAGISVKADITEMTDGDGSTDGAPANTEITSGTCDAVLSSASTLSVTTLKVKGARVCSTELSKNESAVLKNAYVANGACVIDAVSVK